MRGQALRDRRARLRALAEHEAAARCAFKGCQLPLSAQQKAAGVRFCSGLCEEAHDFETARETRR